MKRNELNSNYSNNVFSEYIGCHIFQALGVPSQNTVIGTYEVESGNVKIVVGCEDFTTERYRLHEFQGVQNSFLDSETVGRTPIVHSLPIGHGKALREISLRGDDFTVGDIELQNPYNVFKYL